MAKLFEFSVLVERLIVIYADDEAHARTWFEDMTALGLSEAGDPGEVLSIDLFDVRGGTEDAAHVTAYPMMIRKSDMICLIDVDHDDNYEQLLMKVVKARKKFRCGECGDPIQKGDMYECFVGVLDGIHTHRTCQTCLSIRNKFCCNWTFEGMYEDINDSIENDRSLIDCFLMMASKAEYDQLVRFVPYLDENDD